MTWLLTLFKAFVGSGLAGEIRQAYKDKLDAQTDEARLDAERRIALMEAQERILIEEQKHWMTRWIRPAVAAPFVIFLWKVVVYDTVLQWGVTPHLSDQMYYIMGIVITAYFLGRAYEKRK
jgi:hypothetical protein